MVPMQADVGIDAEGEEWDRLLDEPVNVAVAVLMTCSAVSLSFSAPGCACFGCERYLRDIERLKRLLDCRDNYHQKELEAKQAAVEGMNTAQQDVSIWPTCFSGAFSQHFGGRIYAYVDRLGCLCGYRLGCLQAVLRSYASLWVSGEGPHR